MLLRAHGFTLIELTLATAVFSMMLLIVAQGMLQTYHIQQNSMVSRDTEQNARLAMDTMTREARNASDVTYGGAAQNYLCLATAGGWVEYVVNGNHQLERRTLIPSTPSVGGAPVAACPGTSPPVSVDPITSPSVWVYKLSALKTPGVAPAYVSSVAIDLIVGPQDLGGTLVDSVNDVCNSGVPGSQFCSMTHLSSSVSLETTNQ